MTLGRTEDHTEALDAAVLARTVVAGSHDARLLVPGWQQAPVGYLEDDGQPVLVLPPEQARIEGSACLAITTPGTEVHLGGRLRRCRPREDLAGLLHAHAGCVIGRSVRRGPVSLVRLDVEHVAVTTDGTRRVVPVVAYAVAEPDLFRAHSRALAGHLQSAHGQLLVTLAVRTLGTPVDQVAGVGVRALDPSCVTLDAVTGTGSWRIDVALDPALTDPRELCRRLCALARR